jgi:hypothetical protein
VRGILEKAVRWIKNLVREQEKPFSVGQLAKPATNSTKEIN